MKNQLKVLRAQKSLTQEQLADQLGVTRQTIISIESGRYLPSLPLAFKLARIFQTKIESIFNSEEADL